MTEGEGERERDAAGEPGEGHEPWRAALRARQAPRAGGGDRRVGEDGDGPAADRASRVARPRPRRRRPCRRRAPGGAAPGARVHDDEGPGAGGRRAMAEHGPRHPEEEPQPGAEGAEGGHCQGGVDGQGALEGGGDGPRDPSAPARAPLAERPGCGRSRRDATNSRPAAWGTPPTRSRPPPSAPPHTPARAVSARSHAGRRPLRPPRPGRRRRSRRSPGRTAPPRSRRGASRRPRPPARRPAGASARRRRSRPARSRRRRRSCDHAAPSAGWPRNGPRRSRPCTYVPPGEGCRAPGRADEVALRRATSDASLSPTSSAEPPPRRRGEGGRREGCRALAPCGRRAGPRPPPCPGRPL